jgi:polyvinyl alcohol dehydrogenase (cytochrome)
MRRRLASCAVALAAAALAVPAGASAAAPKAKPGCADTDVPGGEWRNYGQDKANSRFQPKEKLLSVADAPLLAPAWAFSTVDEGGGGDITGTPVVADGCVYVATSRGWVFALNADTGKLVWRSQMPRGGSANATVGLARRRCGRKAYTVRVKRKVKRPRGGKGQRGGKGRRGRDGKRRKRYRWVKVKRYKWVTCESVFVAASRTQAAEGCPQGETCQGPYVAAFDQATGRLAWFTPPLDTQAGSDVYGSPVIFGRTLLIGTSGGSAELGDEADRYAFQGSMNFLDTYKGKVLKKTWTIHPPQQPDDEFAGAGVWSTPAVDAQDKVAFVGTANPFKPQAEHPHANAVVKYDVNRKSKRFGQIIGSYKGNIDEYYPGLSGLPCYDVPGNAPPYYPQGIGSCGDIDLDFGASPNLIRGPNGEKWVGAGQKSGVYHIFDAKTMKPVASQIVGPPTAVGGIVGSTAYDGQNVFGPVTAPGYLWSVRASDAGFRWVGPVADGAHWGNPVATANGVVYTADLSGNLDAYDARNGVLLAKRPLPLGGSGPASPTWGGVSVARNTVYASVGLGSLAEGYVVAFRPGGVQRVPGDIQETIGGAIGGVPGAPSGGGTGTAVVAGPGAVYSTYATPVMTVEKGGSLSFVNLDAPQHDVVADEKGPDGAPVFHSRLGGIGEVVPVEGLDRTQSGKSYGFFCSLHPGMRGTLLVR